MAKKKNRRTIFIVEGHPIVRLGLRQLIRSQRALSVCGEADSAGTALEGIASQRPDLVLMDISLRDSNSGFETLKKIRQRHPALPILVISMHDETLFADRILRAGAQGYIMKKEATGPLIEAIRIVLSGSIYISESETSRLLNAHYARRTDPSAKKRLSERELEVFQMISQGLIAREIAEKLHLSVKTVETHRDHIRRKLQLNDAAELKRYAAQMAPLEPQDAKKTFRILRVRPPRSSH